MSFNKVIIVGNLGKDPELRYTPAEMAVCSFSMATTEKRKDKVGEMQNITTWFNITTWGKTAEAAGKWLKKGSQVYIEGRLSIEEWTDRDGAVRHSLKVNASDMQFIGTKQEGSDEGSAHETAASEIVTQPEGGDDDIPF